jgi:hypothetical protein
MRSLDPGFYRKLRHDAIRFTILIEFLVNLYVFQFLVELIFVPVVLAFVLMQIVAASSPSYDAARKPIDGVLTTIVKLTHPYRDLLRPSGLPVAPKASWTDRIKRAAGVLKSFSLTISPDGSVTAGIDIDAVEGMADTGNLSDDLTDLLVALGEGAQERETGVVFLLDEVQFLRTIEFEALIAALHRTVQRQLPITLVGAGLPSSHALRARLSRTRSACSSFRGSASSRRRRPRRHSHSLRATSA